MLDPRRSLLAVMLTLAGSALLACGHDDDPEGARVLWEKVNAGSGFRSWARAPGFATRKPSFTAHASAVELWVSPEITGALTTPTPAPITTWPLGSVVVKEGFSSENGGSRKLVAIMEKRADGWFWAEYDDSGKSTSSGHPSVCLDCHDNRQSYSDWVYSFELPR